MFLPEAIWKRRLESELYELKLGGGNFEVNADLTEYVVSIRGKGLYKDGDAVKERYTHSVQINLKREYPYPGGLEVVWLTPIFHPNIRAEDGIVCIQLVNEWSESTTIASVVNGLKQLLANPNPQSPLNEDAAQYYLEHSELQQHQPKGPRVVSM